MNSLLRLRQSRDLNQGRKWGLTPKSLKSYLLDHSPITNMEQAVFGPAATTTTTTTIWVSDLLLRYQALLSGEVAISVLRDVLDGE
jgi:hypothetical protein